MKHNKPTPKKCTLTDTQLDVIRKIGKKTEPPKEANGFSLVEWGGHRYVYEYAKKCIVKIAIPGDKSDHNQTEVETYQEASPKIKKILAPVTDYAPDYSWITMPKAKTTKTGLSDMEAYFIYTDLNKEIQSQGFMCWDIDKRQIGKIGKKPVVVDYGFGISCPIGQEKKK